MARPLINVPAKAKRGQVIEIKTLISHIMETGFRHSITGDPIPRDIITEFACSYNGEEIFRAETGAPHAIAVTSATAGLHMVLAALGIGPGDEVVTPSMTFGMGSRGAPLRTKTMRTASPGASALEEMPTPWTPL